MEGDVPPADDLDRPVDRVLRAQPPAGRDPVTGRFARGHELSVTTGAGVFASRDDLPAEIDRDVRAFVDDLQREQGGDGAIRMGFVRRIRQAEAMCLLYERDIRRRGPLTPKGRVRSSARELGAWIDRWARLGEVLGTGARRRDPETIEQFLARREKERRDE